MGEAGIKRPLVEMDGMSYEWAAKIVVIEE